MWSASMNLGLIISFSCFPCLDRKQRKNANQLLLSIKNVPSPFLSSLSLCKIIQRTKKENSDGDEEDEGGDEGFKNGRVDELAEGFVDGDGDGVGGWVESGEFWVSVI